MKNQNQYYDAETSLHYNTFRYYDPELGRFISQDPIGLMGGINLYQYAPNPIEWVDPWGWIRWKTRLIRGMLRNKRKVDFGGRVVYQDDSLFELTQSNITLMSKGKAPFGWDGQRVNLHHLSGKEPGPMLEISASLHQKLHGDLHFFIGNGESFRKDKKLVQQYEEYRNNYWQERLKQMQANGGKCE
ncbi:HNH/ENDO VII family nuclease [Weeksella virosa]|uniref:HNH/ENDO VII family nuclease n=1 Tax=Weeksella virosa TaxID=1014 RepID=UPI000F6C6B7A|nr:HNH/ENDO VII family nuclease [Weeksella virosa]VEH64445.1 Uncharacterized conserved protein [Weeksella virosa]